MRKYMTIIAAAMLGFASTAALSADFYYPAAEQILTIGGDTIEVCKYRGDYPSPTWVCGQRNFPGTPDDPTTEELAVPGPVLVKGAQAAYAIPLCSESALGLVADYAGGYVGIYAGLVNTIIRPSVEVGIEAGIEGGTITGAISGTACPSWQPMQVLVAE